MKEKHKRWLCFTKECLWSVMVRLRLLATTSLVCSVNENQIMYLLWTQYSWTCEINLKTAPMLTQNLSVGWLRRLRWPMKASCSWASLCVLPPPSPFQSQRHTLTGWLCVPLAHARRRPQHINPEGRAAEGLSHFPQKHQLRTGHISAKIQCLVYMKST